MKNEILDRLDCRGQPAWALLAGLLRLSRLVSGTFLLKNGILGRLACQGWPVWTLPVRFWDFFFLGLFS